MNLLARQYWLKWRGFIVIGLLIFGLVLWGGLYKLADRHIIDYVVWRYMVTFKRPIKQVDDYHVRVFKADRRLEVYDNDELLATYPIAISQYGLAPRKIWADSLTPEGEFLIASMQYQSIFGPRQMLLETTAQSLQDYVVQYGAQGKARITAWEQEYGPLDTIWEVYDFNAAHPGYEIWNDILL